MFRQSATGRIERGHLLLKFDGAVRRGHDIARNHIEAIAPGVAEHNRFAMSIENAGKAAQHFAYEDRDCASRRVLNPLKSPNSIARIDLGLLSAAGCSGRWERVRAEGLDRFP